VGAQFVRTAQQQLAGIGELDLFQLRRDDFDVAVESELDRFLATHIVRHGLENGLGIGFLRLDAGCRRKKHRRKNHAGTDVRRRFPVFNSKIRFHT